MMGDKASYTYLALGDSYTIGEGVGVSESFPLQLARRLEPSVQLHSTIVARTGWTTAELLKGIEESQPKGPFDLVTLLIGVNNQYRGYSLEEYREEFQQLLSRAISYADGKKQHVIVLSIPDWGVTPFARDDKRTVPEISTEIDSFNGVNREEAVNARVKYVYITDQSRGAAHDPELLAADDLHPSGKMYAQWVDLVLPALPFG